MEFDDVPLTRHLRIGERIQHGHGIDTVEWSGYGYHERIVTRVGAARLRQKKTSQSNHPRVQ